MCNEIASTTKRTTNLLGLSLLHSPPFRDPIFPTNGNQITHDPEQYFKPESIRVMYVMPTLPSLMPPRNVFPRRRAAENHTTRGGRRETGLRRGDDTCDHGGRGMGKKKYSV